MLRSIATKDFGKLRQLGARFSREEHVAAALLCLDNFFEQVPVVERITYPEVATSLQLFSEYTRLLNSIKPFADHNVGEIISKLFGSHQNTDGNVVLPHCTVLRQYTSGSRNTDRSQDLLPKSAFLKAVVRYIEARISTRVIQLIEATFSEGFGPCIDQIVTGNCC